MRRLAWTLAALLAAGTCIVAVFLVADKRPNNTLDTVPNRETVGPGDHRSVAQPVSDEAAMHPGGGKIDGAGTMKDSETPRTDPLSGNSKTPSKNPVSGDPKSRDERRVSQEVATKLAREACKGRVLVPDDCPVKVELEGDAYVVTFVYVPKRLVPGPVYYAKVWLDRKTGEIRRLLAGS